MANVTTTCRCGHAGLHHRGSALQPTRCRIPCCACDAFTVPAPVRRGVDASWMNPSTLRRHPKGHGPS
jgi:hypothetical protein